MQKHVVLISPVHEWWDVRVFHKQAKSFKESGYKVTLIARIDKPTSINGINIIPAKTSRGSRILRFLKLPLVAVQALRVKGDVYHLHNPDTIIVGLILKCFGKKIVYDTHEDFTRRLQIRSWIPSMLKAPLIAIVRFFEFLISCLTQLTIATQPEVLTRMRGRKLLLGNLPRFDMQQSLLVDKIVKEKVLTRQVSTLDLRAVYIGYINRSRGLFEMLDALVGINNQYKVRLWLAGPGDAPDLKEASEHPGWEFVDYLENLPQEEAFSYVASADVGLIILRDSGGHRKTDPNKIYEYMRFGTPFIASNFSLWMSKLNEVDAGFFINPTSEALVNSLVYCCENRDYIKSYGLRGVEYISKNNWENSFKYLDSEYKKILS